MGKAAAAHLIGPRAAPPNPVSFVPEIVVRQSTAPRKG
jgi:DNA-binding LacI/PurR family transcriptional regulator